MWHPDEPPSSILHSPTSEDDKMGWAILRHTLFTGINYSLTLFHSVMDDFTYLCLLAFVALIVAIQMNYNAMSALVDVNLTSTLEM